MWGPWIHLCTVISLLQKQSVGSNLKGWLCINAYRSRTYLNKIEKHFEKPNFIELAALQPSSLSYDHNQVISSLPWEPKSGFPFCGQPFSPYVKKLQNIALLHLSITYLSITYFNLHYEANTFTS